MEKDRMSAVVKTRKCKSKFGAVFCRATDCPEKVDYRSIVAELRGGQLSFGRYSELRDAKTAMETRNSRLSRLVELADIPEPLADVAEAGVTLSEPVAGVVMGEDNVFIKSVSQYGKDFIVSFGDLTEADEVRELHEADPRCDYQFGECSSVAGELWHLSPHVEDMYIITADGMDEYGHHVFVRLKNGLLLDSQGLWTEGRLLEEWRKSDPGARVERFVELERDEAGEKDANWEVFNQPLFDLLNRIADRSMREHSPA